MELICAELLNDVRTTCPVALDEWLILNKNAASEIKPNNYSDPEKNFLLRLLRDDDRGYKGLNDKCKPRVQLALEFVRHMSKSKDFKDFLLATLKYSEEERKAGENTKTDSESFDQNTSPPKNDDINGGSSKETKSEPRGYRLLHEVAKCGRCAVLAADLGGLTPEKFLSELNINSTNMMGETALHLAAQFEHPRDVEILIKAGAEIEVTHPISLKLGIIHYNDNLSRQ